MIQVDIAIHTVLENDRTGGGAGSLNTLGVTAVFNQRAKRGAALPYIVFNEQSGLRQYTYPAKAWRELIYQVKAITKGTDEAFSRDLAQNIDQRIDALLTDAALSVSGNTLMACRRYEDVSYIEEVSDATYTHEGGLYHVWVTPG